MNTTQNTGYNQDLEYYKELNTVLTGQLNTKADLPAAFRHIICRNPGFINLLQKAAKAAPTDAAIYISGEGGTGKKMIAETIHYCSGNAAGPLVKVHCASIPEGMFENELFGCERGSMPGMQLNGRLGKLELANNGTLYLDEISEMPMSMQIKMLHVLKEKEIERVGGTRKLRTDFRLITSSNKDLADLVAQGKFREDLFYHLNIISVHIPPLRERREDISELINLFLEEMNKSYRRRVTMSKSALSALSVYDWPGNVRELKNLVEQVYVLLPDTVQEIDVNHLPVKITRNTQGILGKTRSSYNLSDIVEKAEKDAIQNALMMTNNNRTQAIEILGISRRNFYLKLKKYDITKS